MSLSEISSQNALYYLRLTNDGLQKSGKRLASGKKFADPSDDPTAAAVSSKLDAATRSLSAASEGVQNLTSFAQTADGFLNVIQGQLGRLSELAVRAKDGTLNADDRTALNEEFSKVRDQINNEVQNASFNGTRVFDASQNVGTAVDASGSNVYTLSIADAGSDVSGISTSNVLTPDAAQLAISQISSSIQNIASSRAKVNADVAALSYTSGNIQSERLNTIQANSRISDVDFAEESTNLAKNGILNRAAVSAVSHGNLAAQNVLKLLT